MVRVVCGHCGKSTNASDAYIGKIVACPGCGEAIEFPEVPGPVAPPVIQPPPLPTEPDARRVRKSRSWWPWWIGGGIIAGIGLLVLAMQPGPIIASSVERAFWRWAVENADDPDSIEIVSIEGPRKSREGPLYQVKTREPLFGMKTLRAKYFIIDENGAREPRNEDTRAQLKYFGFEHFEE